MANKLKGKVAIVTGASKGIGASIAKHLAEEGADVVVNYATSKEGADRVVSEIASKGGKAIAVQADVSKEKDIQRLFTETKKSFGKVDILINNAGIYEFAPLEFISTEHFHKMFDLNVLGLLLACKEALKYLKKGSSIVNISSIAGITPGPNMAVYSATKASVDALTKSLAKELGPRGIRVNTINPGVVETEGVQALGESGVDFREEMLPLTPLGRFGQPKDIAPAAVFLASEDASWITGESIIITGGFH
jgi:3-oxoacyl-[acyl-carrier protein] reductase